MGAYAPILLLPVVKRRLGDPHLAAYLSGLHPSLNLVQRKNYLRLRKL